jgi:hypothetical protein
MTSHDPEADALYELAESGRDIPTGDPSTERWTRFASRCDTFDPTRALVVRRQVAIWQKRMEGRRVTKEEEAASRPAAADVARWLGPLARLASVPELNLTVPKLASEVGDHVGLGDHAAAIAAIAASPALLLLRYLAPGMRQGRYDAREAEILAASPHVRRIVGLGFGDVNVMPDAITTLLGATSFERLASLSLPGGSSVDGMSGAEMMWPTIKVATIEAIAASPGARRLKSLYLENQGLDDRAAGILIGSPHLVSLKDLAIRSGNSIGDAMLEALAKRFGDVT